MSSEIHWLRQGARCTGACRGDAAAMRAETADAPAFRALVVDDLPVHRLLLSGMLKVLFPRAQVEEAGDGRQAQAMLRGGNYDIVLSDWTMPNMDGPALAGWLNSDALSRMPFVLFSAHDMEEEIAQLFSTHGIDGYLIKPFDRAAIRQVVLSAIGVPAPSA